VGKKTDVIGPLNIIIMKFEKTKKSQKWIVRSHDTNNNQILAPINDRNSSTIMLPCNTCKGSLQNPKSSKLGSFAKQGGGLTG